MYSSGLSLSGPAALLFLSLFIVFFTSISVIMGSGIGSTSLLGLAVSAMSKCSLSPSGNSCSPTLTVLFSCCSKCSAYLNRLHSRLHIKGSRASGIFASRSVLMSLLPPQVSIYLLQCYIKKSLCHLIFLTFVISLCFHISLLLLLLVLISCVIFSSCCVITCPINSCAFSFCVL